MKDSRLCRLILRLFFLNLNKTKCHSSRAHICLQVECVSFSFVSFGSVCFFVHYNFFLFCFLFLILESSSSMLSILRSAQRNIRFERREGGDNNKIDSSSNGRTMYTIENDLTVVLRGWERGGIDRERFKKERDTRDKEIDNFSP